MQEMESETECVMCHREINSALLSFEQRLIDDKNFCRECWDGMMSGAQEEEAPLRALS
jgi:hypothetical protein